MATISTGTLSASGAPTYNNPTTTGYYSFDVDLSTLKYGETYSVTGSGSFSNGVSGTKSTFNIDCEWVASDGGEIPVTYIKTNSGRIVSLTVSKTNIVCTVPTKHSQSDRAMNLTVELTFGQKFCNKVVYGDKTLIDLTSDTVTADKLMQGYTAHDRTGALITGTATGGGGTPTLQTKSKTYTPTTSQQTESVTADSGYDGLDAVNITVNAMPSGTAGTPTAAKGTVSNHQVSVTPSVTNTEGYISGGTINGTAVTVSASELVSGTYTVDSSGTKDVTNYAIASVPSGTAGTPTATKGTVSNHSISVTPSVTNTTGYITGSTKTGTAVTVSASELVSGDLSITQNGNNIDCANYSTVSVNVSGGGGESKNTQVVQGTTRTTSSTLTAIGAEMTVTKTGTYDVYWSAFRSSTSSSYTYGTQLYVNGTAYGTQNTTWSNHVQNNHLTGVSLTANQKIRVYGRNSRGSSYYIYAPTLVIVES